MGLQCVAHLASLQETRVYMLSTTNKECFFARYNHSLSFNLIIKVMLTKSYRTSMKLGA